MREELYEELDTLQKNETELLDMRNTIQEMKIS